MLLRIPVIFAVFLSACFGYAQNSPIKITIYSHDSTRVINSPGDTAKVVKGQEYKNLLKWNYCLLGRGIFMINYERHLTNILTLEIGLGVTYSDFIFTSFYDVVGSTNSYQTTTTPSGNTVTTSLLSSPFENSTKHSGMAFELTPRFYVNKDQFEGFYVSPYFSYRNYNYSLTVQETDNTTGAYVVNSRSFDNLNYSFIDVGGKIGYQYSPSERFSFRNYYGNYGHTRTISYNDRFYYDIYFGVAHRSANFYTLQKTDTQGAMGNSTTYATYLQTLSLIQVMFGAKIGYAF